MKRTRIFTCFAMVALSQCGVLASGQAQTLHDAVTNVVLHLDNLTLVNLTNLAMPAPQLTIAANAIKAVSNWKQIDPENASDKSQLENLAQVCYQNKYDPTPYFKDLFPGVRWKKIWWILFLPQEVNIHYPASIEWLLKRIADYHRFSPIAHSVYVLAMQQFPRQFTFNMSQGQIQRLVTAVANHNGSDDQQLQVQALKQQVSELEKSDREKNETIANLQSQLADSLKQQQGLQKSFETSQKQNQELRELFVESQKQSQEQFKLVEEQHQKEIKDLRASFETEMSKLRSQIDAHEQRISTIQQCIAGFTNVSESTNQLMSVANEMKLSNDNAGEITKLHQQIEELSKKFAEVQQTLPQSVLDDVNTRLGTLSANVDVLTTFIKPDQLPDGWIQKNGIAKMLRTLIPMIKSIDQVLKNSDHVSAYKEAFEVQLQRLNSNAK